MASHITKAERDGLIHEHEDFVETFPSLRASVTAGSAVPASRDSILKHVSMVFEKVADIPHVKVKGGMLINNLGIDSLMMLEVISELSSQFATELLLEDMENLTDVDSLASHLLNDHGLGIRSNVSSDAPSTTYYDRTSIESASSLQSSVATLSSNCSLSPRTEQITKFLQEHLELKCTPNLTDNLVDLGLDLLLAIELASDIERLFFVAMDLHQLDALLLHGGGHIQFTRKDIHMKHIKILLDQGFLPISVDYRLCPEVNVKDRPITDACDALAWATSTLSCLELAQPDVQISAGKLVAVGWSSGGHLAMTLAHTAKSRGIQSPDAVLAFYCPSNFVDEWWERPIYPKHVVKSPGAKYDVLEGVYYKPIAGYIPSTPPTSPMTISDPRWRIVIHCNWKAQLLPVLINGFPKRTNPSSSSRDSESLPRPTNEAIRAISPFAQIVAGRYRTPTFIVHGNRGDLIPWPESEHNRGSARSRGSSRVCGSGGVGSRI
ncbi:5-methylorsellinic acid synthase [Cladobotryum mycophilum]|uniref:5-methylorsellinic acid synthase n=1 Tax=Cladobotryum mycophilum TaxID=491253 RepID=A0ABR0STD4_9HYPO